MNDHGQCAHGLSTIAATVVQQNDFAAVNVVGGAGWKMVQDICGDLLGRTPRIGAPVAGIDLIAHRGITHVLRKLERPHLVGGVRFFVNRVWRTEKNGANAQATGKQPFRNVQLELHVTRRDIADVGMREGVVADLVAFVVNSLRNAREFVRLNADHEERCRRMLALQHIEDLRRPLGIGTVVKRDRDFVGTVAIAAQTVRLRQRLEYFVGDHLRVRINRQITRAVGRPLFDA